MLNDEYRIWDIGYRMVDIGYRGWDVGCECWIQDIGFRMLRKANVECVLRKHFKDLLLI